MTCLIDKSLSGAGMKSFTSMLGTFFKHLGTMYADFQEKIFAEISGKTFQTFHCSSVIIGEGLKNSLYLGHVFWSPSSPWIADTSAVFKFGLALWP